MKKAIYILFVINLLIMNNLFAQKDGELVDVVQQPATFPGGTKGVIKFINDNLEYPKSALRNNIQGTVYIKFIVDKDGSIMKDCVKVARSIDPELDAEALRVVRMMPNWIPAKQFERPVRQRMRIPVKFKTDVDSFVKSIVGGWIVDKMVSSNIKTANSIFELQKKADYRLVNANESLNITITFEDDNIFSGTFLVESNKEKTLGLLTISWKTDIDKKLLKKYGLTDFILLEKPTQEGNKVTTKLAIIDPKGGKITLSNLKEKNKVIILECI